MAIPVQKKEKEAGLWLSRCSSHQCVWLINRQLPAIGDFLRPSSRSAHTGMRPHRLANSGPVTTSSAPGVAERGTAGEGMPGGRSAAATETL